MPPLPRREPFGGLAGVVSVPTRRALQRLAAVLGEASPCTPQDMRIPTVFTRLDEHCRPAERLARMVLGNQTLRCTAGTAGAAVFLIDMNTAFETFVAARLARYLTHWSARSRADPSAMAGPRGSGPT